MRKLKAGEEAAMMDAELYQGFSLSKGDKDL